MKGAAIFLNCKFIVFSRHYLSASSFNNPLSDTTIDQAVQGNA